MGATKLNRTLASDQLEMARARGLIFGVNRGGKITCTSRDTAWVGLGASPRRALEDWLAKSAIEDRGSN